MVLTVFILLMPVMVLTDYKLRLEFRILLSFGLLVQGKMDLSMLSSLAAKDGGQYCTESTLYCASYERSKHGPLSMGSVASTLSSF